MTKRTFLLILFLLAIGGIAYWYWRKKKGRQLSLKSGKSNLTPERFKELKANNPSEAKRLARSIYDQALELKKYFNNEKVKNDYIAWLSKEKESSLLTNTYPALSMWLEGVVDTPFQSIVRSFIAYYQTKNGNVEFSAIAPAIEKVGDRELYVRANEVDRLFDVNDIVIGAYNYQVF